MFAPLSSNKTSTDIRKLVLIPTFDAGERECDRCTALGDERFGGGEARRLEFFAKLGLHLVDVFGAVLVCET